MTPWKDGPRDAAPSQRWSKTVGSLSLACHVITVQHEAVGSAQHVHQGRPSALLRIVWEPSEGTHPSASTFLESWGEACPLPGFGPPQSPSHQDSLDLALEQLEALSPQELQASLRSPEPWIELDALTANLSSPSARHAIETAVASLVAQARGRPLWQLLSERTGKANPCARVITSAALDPLADGFAERLSQATASGVSTIKLKVGKHLDRELNTLSLLSGQALHSGAPTTRATSNVYRTPLGPPSLNSDPAPLEPQPLRLRLDANLSLDRAGAVRLAQAARRAEAASSGSLVIEWLEDPTPEPSDWADLSRLVPIAVDEALQDPRLCPSKLFGNLETFRPVALVLKPMALGLNQALDWASRAADARIDTVVSHYFDGVVALMASAHLAFAVQTASRAAGLGLHPSVDAWNTTAELPATLPKLPPWMQAADWVAPTSLDPAGCAR